MTNDKIPLKLAENIIKKHGHHKIFFGTDIPLPPSKTPFIH